MPGVIYHYPPDVSRGPPRAFGTRAEQFGVRDHGGRPGRPLTDLFEGFGEHDRLGVVIGRPGGALGASALITAAITAFYDLQRARGPDFFIYPDYYLFHVGKPFGDHSRLDIWPAHKEVVVAADPREVLRAVNDRAITRLAGRGRRAPGGELGGARSWPAPAPA